MTELKDLIVVGGTKGESILDTGRGQLNSVRLKLNKTPDTFEVIRNEEEHKNNCLHFELKKWYNYYCSMGCTKQQAIKYSKWNIQNRDYWEKKEDE